MSFLKKLKDKLFNLEPAPKVSKKDPQPVAKSASNQPTKAPVKANEKKLQEAEKQLAKKIASTIKEEKSKSSRIRKYLFGLKKSNQSFGDALKLIQNRHVKLDEAFFEELEEQLILNDISVRLAMVLTNEIKTEVKKQNITDVQLINDIVAEKMHELYTGEEFTSTELNIQKGRLNVVLVTGVNGVGKTTTIAKISHKYISSGFKVLIAAGDTFRAGAIEQLAIWAERVGADIVKPSQENADPASVVYDSLKKAKNGGYDLLIIDTAGRLQNKVNLMNELAKINKIITREVPDAPHESLLVIDATTGQNGVLQAAAFKEVTPLSGIVLTKMDGSSKGGIILTIKDQLNIAVKLIGLGEKIDDLQEFDLDAFIFGLAGNVESVQNA